MDIARAPQKKTGRNIAIGAGAAVVILATIALSNLDPAAPTVQRVAILIDSVRQGDVVREVHWRSEGEVRLPTRIVTDSGVEVLEWARAGDAFLPSRYRTVPSNDGPREDVRLEEPVWE